MTKFAVVGPISMGKPDEFSVSTLAEKELSKMGRSSSIVHLPLPSGDPAQTRLFIGQAKRLLGWAQKVTLIEGLDKTIPYFRNVLGDDR